MRHAADETTLYNTPVSPGSRLGCSDVDGTSVPDPRFKKLYPHLNEEELRAAEENLDEYLDFALELFERILADPIAYAEFETLTGDERPDTAKRNPDATN